MEFPRPLQNLIDYANTVDVSTPERKLGLEAYLVTPTQQIPFLVPTGFARMCAFATNHSDDCRIAGQLQPGVYQNQILPYKDNLYMEVIEQENGQQTMKRYRCVPVGDTDNQMAGNHTVMADLAGKDDLNLITITFQLFETGYAILKTQPANDLFIMSKLVNVIQTVLTEVGKRELNSLTGPDAFRGVDIELPIDNDRVFKQIIIPNGVQLVNLVDFLQANEEFGIYSRGIGSYYRKGMWYIYPLFKLGRYETAKNVLDVYRLPSNVFPTLKRTFYQIDRKLTVLSTGGGEVIDGSDIDKQNVGSGKRVISSDALMAEVGYYYDRGKAVTTRSDSLNEYKTSTRGSGEEFIPFHTEPTNNLCKLLSRNAYNDGTIVQVDWHNSNSLKITPGMPVRYFFMNGDQLMYREGTVLAIRSDYQKDTQSLKPVFREISKLELWIFKQAQVVTR